MTDADANTDPVLFDHDAAARLAARFRAAATELRTQTGYRKSFQDGAVAEWRGIYAEKFVERMNLCIQDAHKFADSMLLAANQLDELSRLAREEQTRRDQAVAWVKHEQSEGNVEKVVDWLLNRDDRAPIADPVAPRTFTIEAPPAAQQRG